MIFLTILFWISLFGISILMFYPVYSYSKYIWKKSKPQLNKNNDEPLFSKPVSIIITIYNEENYIQQRIDFFIEKNEWIEGSEIIVISTGSIDKTNEILTTYLENKKIKIIILNERISKIKALNTFVESCKNEIIIFSDCRQKIKPNAVKNLIQHFSNNEIAAVSSTLVDTKFKSKPSLFRKTLNAILIWDSYAGSCLNNYGALYAQRKSTFQPFPENLLFDDLFVVVSIINQNKRIIQEPTVQIEDIEFEKYYQKERLERLIRGLLIFYFNNKKMIFQMPFPIMIRFLIFKYLKLLMPLFLFFILLYSGFLLPFSSASLLICFGSIILILLLFTKTRKLFVHFIQINYYFFNACFKFLILKNRTNTWSPLNQTKILTPIKK